MGSFESKPEDTLSEKDRIKLYKKELRKALSSLERETRKMEAQEAKLKASVLQKGKEGGAKSPELRTFVKDYLRTKKTISKFYTMRSSLMGVQTTIEMTASTLSLKEGLRNASSALRSLNGSINIKEMRGILQDFATGVGDSEILQEEMGEAIDGVMDDPNQAEEEEGMINDVINTLKLEEQAKQLGQPAARLSMPAPQAIGMGPTSIPLGGGALAPSGLPCVRCNQFGHEPQNCPSGGMGGGMPPPGMGFHGGGAGMGAGGAGGGGGGGFIGGMGGMGGGGQPPSAPPGFGGAAAGGGGGGGAASDLQARLNALSGKPPP